MLIFSVVTKDITLTARKVDMCLFMLESYVDINVTETKTELTTITQKAMSTALG